MGGKSQGTVIGLTYEMEIPEDSKWLSSTVWLHGLVTVERSNSVTPKSSKFKVFKILPKKREQPYKAVSVEFEQQTSLEIINKFNLTVIGKKTDQIKPTRSNRPNRVWVDFYKIYQTVRTKSEINIIN